MSQGQTRVDTENITLLGYIGICICKYLFILIQRQICFCIGVCRGIEACAAVRSVLVCGVCSCYTCAEAGIGFHSSSAGIISWCLGQPTIKSQGVFSRLGSPSDIPPLPQALCPALQRGRTQRLAGSWPGRGLVLACFSPGQLLVYCVHETAVCWQPLWGSPT